jgi:hypothetical protein
MVLYKVKPTFGFGVIFRESMEDFFCFFEGVRD